MKKTFILIAIFLQYFLASAQDFPFGKPSSKEFELKRYDKDTSANAVVLKEFGTAYINNNDGELMFEYHVRIKIFNSKGFKYGNIEIPTVREDADSFEKISNIKAVTFYNDADHLIRSSELDPKQIFKESKADKYHDITKFAMPNLRDSCIIEYSYTLQTPFFFRTFRNWDFQSDIPKIYSEYCAKIPGVYSYNVSLRGPYKLTKSDGEIARECFDRGRGYKADCSKMTYAMADIPAFIEEDYMTAASNFKSAMYFELTEFIDYQGIKHKFSKEWKDIDLDLKKEGYFGTQLRKKDFFEDKIAPVIAGKTSELDKAKAIFSFMQTWFKWNRYYGKYSDGIKKAFDNRSGSSADINLALVTAINSAGLVAEPVILSTRSNGLLNDLYPALSDFDYVICKVTIGEKYYLLDATDPMLPFGLLPLRCINDKGRVMSFDKPSSWIDITASQKESQSINLDLEVDETGKIKGRMQVLSSGYEAYNKRNAIKKFNSTDEYVEDLDERYPKIKFTKSEIQNIDSLEKSLLESFEIEIKAQGNGQVNVNPYFLNRIKENPFKLTERTYPVDLGAISESRVVMNLKFPESFQIVNKPQPLAISLPNQGGRFITQTTVEGNTLTLSCFLQHTKSVYSSEEYFYLKELYNKIIQTQQSDIIIKKKL